MAVHQKRLSRREKDAYSRSMPFGATEYVLVLEPIPSHARRELLGDVASGLWKVVKKELRRRDIWSAIQPDCWDYYQTTIADVAAEAQAQYSGEGPVTLELVFPDMSGLAASAQLACHWTALAISKSRSTIERQLAKAGWKATIPELDAILASESAGVATWRGAPLIVSELPSGTAIEDASDLFVVDRGLDQEPPRLGDGSPSERDGVAWVAMTRLCQCQMCSDLAMKVGTFLSPSRYIAAARRAWQLLETDREVRALGHAAWCEYPRGTGPHMAALTSALAARDAALPAVALRGMLRDREATSSG